MTDWAREEVGVGVWRAPIVRFTTSVDIGPQAPPGTGPLPGDRRVEKLEAEVAALQSATKGMRIEVTALRKRLAKARL